MKSSARPVRAVFNPYPKYMQIADLLRKRVLAQMKPGDRLPPETVLSRELGVSRETLRQALAPLERERLITRTRGRGSFVSERVQVRAPEKLTGMTEDMVSLGMKTRATVLGHGLIEADDVVAEYLRLRPRTPVVRIDRLRLLDDQPLSRHVAYLPVDVGARVLQEDLENNSIVLVLRQRLHYALEEDRQVVEADSADVKLAEQLGVPMLSPLLLVRRLYITSQERPIAYFLSYFRADRYMYTVKLRQPDAKPSGGTARKKAAPARRRAGGGR